MQRLVAIVGTSHVYQWAGKDLSPADLAAFMHFLSAVQQRSAAVAIAEEMSLEALAEHSCRASTVAAVCLKSGLLHAYCDPDAAERVALGIVRDESIELRHHLDGLPKEDVARLIRLEYDKREAEWLKRLRQLDAWPVVFVCGSSHVTSFADLLRSQGFLVAVEAHDWPHSVANSPTR